MEIRSESELAGAALGLGARCVAGWSAAEKALVSQLKAGSTRLVLALEEQIQQGADPLGDALCRLRSPEERRPQGATYTPRGIVDAMVRWAQETQEPPVRIVDPGTGSGRFLVAAARAFPRASLVGVELDPLAALIARAHLAAAGLATRSTIVVGDYRSAALAPVAGRTLFIGNPPYVRHHLIDERWKRWLSETAARLGVRASQLAGLHAHFFLATAERAARGDLGAFITAAEWLDVNYGQLVRDLLLGPLGGTNLTVIEPTARPFADAASTAAIVCFEVGARPRSIHVRRVDALDDLEPLGRGRPVKRERLVASARWTPLTRSTRATPPGYVELGELFRVHRGQVTGANKVWIARGDCDLPSSVCFPTVTRARELFAAGTVLDDARGLKRVIDLPVDLDLFDRPDKERIERFLRQARAAGAHQGYIASRRKAWWSVGLREPAPILATYMARRPPAFVLNRAAVRHINIAHGLYPREPLPARAIDVLTRYLSTGVNVVDGRTYAGGLTKFEPREMERLLVPGRELLEQGSSA